MKDHSEGFSLLGNLVKCEEKYTKAVQILLSDFLETLVSLGDSDADLFSWIEANEKNLDFLKLTNGEKLSAETVERLKITLGDGLVSLSDVLEMEEGLKQKLAAFLDGYFIASELTADAFNKSF